MENRVVEALRSFDCSMSDEGCLDPDHKRARAVLPIAEAQARMVEAATHVVLDCEHEFPDEAAMEGHAQVGLARLRAALSELSEL